VALPRVDILAIIDHHAYNGRREALRRNALGSANLIDYLWRSLLHSGAPPACQGTLNY
jgi:transposase